MFQSSPGFEAGRYHRYAGIPVGFSMFQSSPGFEAGRYAAHSPGWPASSNCSNPRPVLRPGATLQGLWAIGQDDVPILARF